MAESIGTVQTALKYEVEVQDQGRVELHVPFASESSLGFWDNPLDDEDWNHA